MIILLYSKCYYAIKYICKKYIKYIILIHLFVKTTLFFSYKHIQCILTKYAIIIISVIYTNDGHIYDGLDDLHEGWKLENYESAT